MVKIPKCTTTVIQPKYYVCRRKIVYNNIEHHLGYGLPVPGHLLHFSDKQWVETT